MKKEILTLVLFAVGLFTIDLVVDNGNKKELGFEQQELQQMCIGTPSDRNCNGIPDWME